MTKTFIIGCGRMAQNHIKAVKGLDFDLVGVTDIFPEAMQTAKENCDLTDNLLYASFDKFLEKNSAPDLIIISTTATSHCEYTIQAANAGVKYILCEKPMAVSVEECDLMIKACEDNGSLLAINHPVRFTEADMQIKELLNSDKMGGLNGINISAGNFGLAMNVSHNLEMFRYLTDEEITSVQSWFDKDVVSNPRGEQFEDRSGQMMVKTSSNKTMTINANVNNGHGIIVTYAAKHGQIALNVLTGDAMVTYRQAEFREKPTTLYGLPAENEYLKLSSSDLIVRAQKVMQALLAGKDYPDARTVKRTVEILTGAYVSNENDNKEVNVETDKIPTTRKFPWA